KLTIDELRPPRPDGNDQKGPDNNQQPPPRGNGPGNGKGGQQGGGPRKGPGGGGKGPSQDGGQPGGVPGDQGGRRPAPPTIAARAADGDGLISADEIANASAALRKLDKNDDGQLTPDEYHPRPPKRDDQQGGSKNKRGGGSKDGHDKDGGATK